MPHGAGNLGHLRGKSSGAAPLWTQSSRGIGGAFGRFDRVDAGGVTDARDAAFLDGGETDARAPFFFDAGGVTDARAPALFDFGASSTGRSDSRSSHSAFTSIVSRRGGRSDGGECTGIGGGPLRFAPGMGGGSFFFSARPVRSSACRS